MGLRRIFRWSDCFRRLAAAGAAAVVLALGLLAANPILHDQLHHHGDSAGGDSCAVVMFAGGVSVPVVATALPLRSREWRAERPVVATEIVVDSPRYRFRPTNGPPGGC